MKPATLAALITLAAAGTALAGPPWISIELRPAGAPFMMVRTFHHGEPNAMALRGSAEGLIGGRRTSVPLRFEQVGSSNVYGVAKNWTDGGVWVLNLASAASAEETHGGAGAVVLIDRTGSASVRFPRKVDGTSRAATAGEIEAMLRSLDAGQTPPALSRTGWLMVLIPTLVPIGALMLLTTVAWKIGHAVAAKVRGARAERRAVTVPAL